MATSCNTHDYDGQLREKWFQMRPMLIEKYLPQCLSFDDTLKEIEQWLDRKYFNVKRIGRARRSLRILETHRKSNFDSRNDIDVEELLPILWDKVRNANDIHDTFYEQLCDITGGSCAQGRSTRLFQFLFLFDLPSESVEKNTSSTITENGSIPTSEEPKPSGEQPTEGEEQQTNDPESSVEQITEGEKAEVNGTDPEPLSTLTENKEERS